jgi:hypothetical protein
MMLLRSLLLTLATAAVSASAAAQPSFRVTLDPGVRRDPATGRLVVYLIRDGARIRDDAPAGGPFLDDPQPMYGIDVHDLAPGGAVVVDDSATSFPVKLSQLPAGRYQAQAVLDMSRLDSSWRREPGNLFSTPRSVDLAPGNSPPIDLSLAATVPETKHDPVPGVEPFEMRSELLSKFRGHDVILRASVIPPADRDPSRDYAAVYEVPGFGADHLRGIGPFHPYFRRPEGSSWIDLRRSAFWIVLNPEGPNGHHLFANSANNGPVEDALITELIPALEKKYNLAPRPEARLLRGHSSGGWATLWLATQHPDIFGATWSSSPDPVDFRRLQRSDIYSADNIYFEGAEPSKVEVPSYRRGTAVLCTVRQENLMEEVLGPDNTSGQQWDSWFAVFGPRNAAGHPAALFNPLAGAIDRTIAEQYRKYDIADLLRRDPARYVPIFRDRIRILVGEADSYYLNEAVALLKEQLASLEPAGPAEENARGHIRILPGRDHSSIYADPAMLAIPAEMVDHLRRAGLIPR